MTSGQRDFLFLQSAMNLEGHYMSNPKVINWINERRNAVKVEINLTTFSKLVNWEFDNNSSNLRHISGHFFSIDGISLNTNWGHVSSWDQPIINQPEIGILGIISKKINGVLHFLMQAKIEPGNIDYVQISPTLQATKSNYSRVHNGKVPSYLEYFNGKKNKVVLLDQLQSEQGARFLKKRNRNIIIEIFEEIPVYDDFTWLTLGQIKALMLHDNLINMDTRTVLSGISYGNKNNRDLIRISQIFDKQNKFRTNHAKEMLISALKENGSVNTLEGIISWLTELKTKYFMEVNPISLNKVRNWKISDTEIYHENNKYFSVIATEIYIANREVSSWHQPLVKSSQDGLIGFIVKKINGIYHFLVQAKIEAGNFDIFELAPTVQCLTGNYRKGLNEYDVEFIDQITDCPDGAIIYKSYQSEEGGRFYREQNLNIIIQASDDFSNDLPENYCWITLNQLYTFIKFNNYLNIQARSLLAAINFN